MSARLYCVASLLCLSLYDCGASSRFEPRKADPAKGTVTGTVLCTDTGKPARFAVVSLLPDSAGPKRNPEPTQEVAITDLEGKFKIEAVAPGTYYAVATLAGYLDPQYGLDFSRIGKDEQGNERMSDIVAQWKDHMVETTVTAQQVSDIHIDIERGAEITGTVTYDDGSPAIGVRFALYRRDDKGAWFSVGQFAHDDFAIDIATDSRGRYSVTNLPAGEYIVCTLVPGDNQDNSPQICLGNVFRKRDARSVSVSPGDTAGGNDIIVPLRAIHPVGGTLAQAAASQQPVKAKLRLLYADDRDAAMTISTFSDGSFLFPFVPEGAYVLEISEATYSEQSATAASAQSGDKPAPRVHKLANRQVPLTIDKDLTDLNIPLVELPSRKSAQP